MNDKPEYRLHMAPFPGRVTVMWRGQVIADSAHAIKLEESRHDPVYYLPRGDARMELFQPSARSSHCPHKGDARYFSLVFADGGRAENAVWSYETPIAKSAAIKEHLAFYTKDMGADFGIEVIPTPLSASP